MSHHLPGLSPNLLICSLSLFLRHMRCIRSGSSLIWVMNYHCFSALFLPSLSSVSPPTFLMKSDFTKWETFKFLCFENNFCSGSGLEWETCLTPASSNAVLSQVPIGMLVACIVAVGIFPVTTGAGQNTWSGPGLLAFQPYPEHITEEVIYFPVNHLGLSGLLMMCGWVLGALWMSPGHVFSMALCCLPQVSSHLDRLMMQKFEKCQGLV